MPIFFFFPQTNSFYLCAVVQLNMKSCTVYLDTIIFYFAGPSVSSPLLQNSCTKAEQQKSALDRPEAAGGYRI